jgi:molybdenum cofactor cytidylyltransferase
MGLPKTLLPWNDRPLVRHVAEVALASRLDELVVVSGYYAEELAAALRDLPLRIVHNPAYRTGLASSLRTGIAAVAEGASGALILLADQPFLTTDVVDRMLDLFAQTAAPVVAPVAQGRRGNPVLFARPLFPALLAISGDEGARDVVRANRHRMQTVEVDASVFEDVDTPESYARLAESERS